MKKTTPVTSVRFGIIIFMCLLFGPFLSRAQIVGGGGTQPYSNGPASNTNVNQDDKYFSLNFGIISPEGLFSTPYSFGNTDFTNLSAPFKGLGGLGAKMGYCLNFTGFSALSKFPMGGNAQGRFGILFGLDIGFNPISWSNVPWSTYGNGMTVTTTGFFYDGLKFGPQININPMENMGICFYATIDPYLTIPGGENANYDVTDASGNEYIGTYDVSDSSGIHLNINASVGIAFYYKALMLGIEYNWVHTKYNGSVKQNETQYYSNGSQATAAADYSFTSKIQTNMLKVTIGLRFGGHHT